MSPRGLTCIIDDSDEYRSVLQQLLSNCLPDYPVLFFADSQTFLDELPSLGVVPHLILLDWHMPTLDGYQTLLKLKEVADFRMIPVIMMSTMVTPAEIAGGYHAGASGLLFKQTDLLVVKEDLVDIFHFWIGN